jgi:hypothetical protein
MRGDGKKTASSARSVNTAMKFICLALLLLVGCSAKSDRLYWVKQGAAREYFDSSGRSWAVVSPEGTKFKVVERCSDPPTTSSFDFEVYARNYAEGLCRLNHRLKKDKK